MFNLEQSIAEWTRQLRKNQYMEDGDILEMTLHLREKIEYLTVTGLSEEEAFLKAVELFKPDQRVDTEYAMARSAGRIFTFSRLLPPLLGNYVMTAIRQIRRQSVRSAINVAGLAIGLASFILISLWVHDELHYDSYNKNIDRLHIVIVADQDVVTPYGLSPELQANYPQIEKATRFVDNDRSLLSMEDKSIMEEGGVFVDPAFFDMFTYSFIEKVPGNPLATPQGIVLTESVARKLFPNDPAVGKTLVVNKKETVVVTGVMRDVPPQSSYTFRYARPVSVLADRGHDLTDWKYNQLRTFVLLREDADPKAVTAEIADLAIRHTDANAGHLSLWAYGKLHLSTFSETGPGTPVYVYMLSGMALFILLIACINFINLTTAASALRKKEIGIRKALGAGRGQLIAQLLGETFVMVVIATGLSLFLVELSLPRFNLLVEKQMVLNYADPGTLLYLFSLVIVMTALAGFYPAIYLSSLGTHHALTQKRKSLFHRPSARSALAILQFTLAAILITAALIVQSQVSFMRNKDTGIEKQHIVTARTTRNIREKRDGFRQALLSHPSIADITLTSTDPVEIGCTLGEDSIQFDGKPDKFDTYIHFMSVDHHYGDTFHVSMEQGRFFSEDFPTDTLGAVVLNEKAVQMFGMADPIGQSFTVWDQQATVVGVMKDFHFRSLHHRVEPLVMQVLPWWHTVMCIRIQAGSEQDALKHIEASWNLFEKDIPFRYEFLDQRIDRQYKSEKKIAVLIRALGILAIFISCIGLFGLTVHTTTQRTKEIGIRKTMGAGNGTIFRLLTAQPMKWVVLSNILAFPVSYYAHTRWLSHFAYRTHLSAGFFATTAAATLLVTLLTVSYHCWKAVRANPVIALRDE